MKERVVPVILMPFTALFYLNPNGTIGRALVPFIHFIVMIALLITPLLSFG